ncbi:MAG: tetratricopeptide repeat protein [Planctomycetota bacterium]|nr:tetratricopeptide repeat protein [Planctomycetota bacterium]
MSDPDYKPRKRIFAKMVGIAVAGGGALVAGWELGSYLVESYQRRALVSNWVDAARELYEVEGAPERSREMLDQARELAPQNVDVVKLSAYIEGMGVVERLLNLDRPFGTEDVDAYGQAMGQAIMLERVDPDAPEWALLRGQLALAAREPHRAERFLQQAVDRDPESAFAHMRLALVHMNLALAEEDQDKQASELVTCNQLLDEALSLDPRSKWCLLWKGLVVFELQADPEGAIEWYKKALEVDPRFANAWLSLGSAQEGLQLWDEAQSSYLRALELRPDLAQALVGLGYVHGAQDRYEIGLRYARAATETDKGSLEAWNMRGLLARELAGDLGSTPEEIADRDALVQEAIDAYSAALDLNPQSADAYIERSNLNRTAGRLREAGNDARNGVLFGPDDPYAWNALAKFQSSAGLLAKSEETFTKVLELDPEFDTAYLDRAACRVAQGNRIGAAEDLEAALANATDDFRVEILIARGDLRRTDADLHAALADYVAARELDPNSFDAWIAEARLLAQLNRTEQAKEAATHAIELHPGDEEARALAGG